MADQDDFQKLRVGFAGTPEFAATALEALVQSGCQIPLVLTQPDRPAGRGLKLQASPVKQRALHYSLPVSQPQGLRLDGKYPQDAQAARQLLDGAALDVLVVAAYGLILPSWVLLTPRLGCFNIHASLLPRWRGAAPIHRAIEAGDTKTGITLMQMDAGLDTGDMLLLQAVDITPFDTTATLHDRLAATGAHLMMTGLHQALQGRLQCMPQPEIGVTYAHKIEKAEASIAWDRWDADQLERRLRAFDPFPGCSTVIHGETIKIWQGQAWTLGAADSHSHPGQILSQDAQSFTVRCLQGCLRITQVQRPGGKRISAAAFLQNAPDLQGISLL
jgi:methionyl-tRNA formyltransferase